MAISVDRVYQTVLALANKEQRGYITPQEFNLFANHAQNEIFEQYFYDLNQFLRAPIGNKTVSSDLRDITEEKISIFRVTNAVIGGYAFPSNMHKLEGLSARFGNDDGAIYYPAEEVTKKEYDTYEQAALTKPSFKRPIFYRYSNNFLISPPDVWGAFMLDYITRPVPPNWTYVTVQGAAMWNPTLDTQNFQLHESEEKNLVVKILKFAGVAIKDPDLVQAAGQQEGAYIQQEKS